MMTATPAELMTCAPPADVPARGRRLTDLIVMACARFVSPPDPVEAIARAERREAARRAIDTLLLR